MSFRIFKVVLLGDAGVGKTSIRKKYMGEGFEKSILPTIGADFALYRMKSSIIQIWDLAGQTNLLRIRKKYILGAHGIIFVYSQTDKTSLDNLNTWFDEAYKALGHNVPCIVTGNKNDLQDEIEVVDNDVKEIIIKLEKQYTTKIPVFKTSASSGENIEEIFKTLINHIKNQ